MSTRKKVTERMGSSLDEFLEGKGVRGEFEARAIKEVIAWQLQEAMRARGISKARMASMMGTSLAQLDRLLDPERDVTLSTLHRAAALVVGRTLRLELI